MGVREMKDLIISKELISEVLDIKLEDIVSFKMFMNELFYYRELLPRADCQGNISKHRDSIQQSINIYEFAFKCKEWARNKYDITISSSLYKNYAKSWNIDKDKSYTAKTEVEVIIEACEGILEQNK